VAEKAFGLALGGGGSRTLAHAGVLRALAEAGLAPSYLAGSSLGAVLAAAYACDPDGARFEREMIRYFRDHPLFGRHRRPARTDGLAAGETRRSRWRKYFRTAAFANINAARPFLLRRNPTHRAIRDLVPDRSFAETALPFACNALDLTRGRLVTFTEGPLRRALRAGTAIGFVFPPERLDGALHVDAAPLSSVPVRACRSLGAPVVLAVDLRTELPDPFPVHNGFDIISRIESMESRALNDQEVAEADVVIRPGVGSVFWGDFTQVEAVAEAGAAALGEALPQLRDALAAPQS
jgi:NTE family protein